VATIFFYDGSQIALQFDKTGAVELHQVYGAFGKVTSEPGTLAHLFAYTGRPLDEGTGLQDNLHRWYDASVWERGDVGQRPLHRQ